MLSAIYAEHPVMMKSIMETFSTIIKDFFNINIKYLRFFALLIRPLGLFTQALQLGIFTNICQYYLF